MSPSMDQPRRVRVARHRATPTEQFATPTATAPKRGAHAKTAATVEPAEPPETAPASTPASSVSVGGASVSVPPATAPIGFATVDAAPATSRKEPPAGTTTAGAAPAGPSRAQLPAPLGSGPRAVLKKATSVRVTGHRMAVVAGALAVVIGAGSAGPAAARAFLGQGSSTQDARAEETTQTSGLTTTRASRPAAASAAAPKPNWAPSLPTVAGPGTGGNAPSTPGTGLAPPVAVTSPAPAGAPTAPGAAPATASAAPATAGAAPATAAAASPSASPDRTRKPAHPRDDR